MSRIADRAASAQASATHIAHFIVMPKGVPPVLMGMIEDAAHSVLDLHGPSAFAATRDAAIVHEVGHAIVGAAEGLTIRHIRIFSQSVPPFGVAWGGQCREVGAWTSGPDTTAESDLRRARFIIAGLAAEKICGMDKPGSSLDELVLSQFVSLNAAAKLLDSMSDAEHLVAREQLWHTQVWQAAGAILHANREPFQQLANLLSSHSKVHGALLRAVLAQVQS
jgi:hypothetical protein